ncbi:MAG: chromate transporter [Clostridia bacterium]|nr:chromate transporter [Clostridia bacterium]
MNIYLLLFLTFFKIGLFTFGGGYAMLPLIQEEVLKYNWIPLEDFINFVAVSESTPGPFAVNIATYVGSVLGGVPGSACATLGVIMPSIIIILIVARIFEQFRSNKYVSAAMDGLKPAAVGLIASAVITIGKTVFFANGVTIDVFTHAKFYVSLVTFAVMMFLYFKKKLHPIAIICISAVIGIVSGYIIG